jgi:hypothetical protein
MANWSTFPVAGVPVEPISKVRYFWNLLSSFLPITRKAAKHAQGYGRFFKSHLTFGESSVDRFFNLA